MPSVNGSVSFLEFFVHLYWLPSYKQLMQMSGNTDLRRRWSKVIFVCFSSLSAHPYKWLQYHTEILTVFFLPAIQLSYVTLDYLQRFQLRLHNIFCWDWVQQICRCHQPMHQSVVQLTNPKDKMPSQHQDRLKKWAQGEPHKNKSKCKILHLVMVTPTISISQGM